jgi:hypothetical protein
LVDAASARSNEDKNKKTKAVAERHDEVEEQRTPTTAFPAIRLRTDDVPILIASSVLLLSFSGTDMF